MAANQQAGLSGIVNLMELMLIVLGLLTLIELGLWTPGLWRLRRPLAAILLVALAAVAGWFLAIYFTVTAVIFTFFNIYRLLNLLRIVENRSHADYLFHTSRISSLWLIGIQAVIIGVDRLVSANHINILTCFYILAAAQVIAAAVLLGSTIRHLRTTQPPQLEDNLASRDLPSLTVAIPARNETEDLELCLRSLLQSNYPKLEILVLDDCSQNKRTPEIIRGFAHDGVRFIAGKIPPEGWLAKNYAYKQLSEEANGDLLLFCGVDCRFEPQTLTNLVKTMLQKHKSMISIMPKNVSTSTISIKSTLVQPSRYAWELALPRRMLGRPPVLSTCWIVTKDLLKISGGFGAVGRKIVPESYLSKVAASHEDGYSFMQADSSIGVSSTKSFDEQKATAIRTRYPQLHRRPELVALTTAAEAIVLLWPLILVVAAILSGEWPLVALSTLGYAAVATLHSKIVNLTYRRFMVGGVWVLPIAAVFDIGVLNYSMWQYEFSEVIWKGRNVCMPVMRVTESLPKLP